MSVTISPGAGRATIEWLSDRRIVVASRDRDSDDKKRREEGSKGGRKREESCRETPETPGANRSRTFARGGTVAEGTEPFDDGICRDP